MSTEKFCPIKCDICGTSFKTKYLADRHPSTKTHLDKLRKLEKRTQKEELKSKLKASNDYVFELKNKEGMIIAKTTVDEDMYHHIIDNSGSLSLMGDYVNLHILMENNIKKSFRLHRYIFYKNNKQSEDENILIDHINNDPLDNRLSNLREANFEDNSKNRSKSKNATSKYFGVYFSRDENKWVCSLKHVHSYKIRYENELHAAYHYDLLVKELKLEKFQKLNNIEKPEDFILKVNFKKTTSLPKGIYAKKDKYFYSITNNEHYYGYSSVEDALKARNDHLKKNEAEKENMILLAPIKRNSNDVAIIKLYKGRGKNRERISETMIDDEDYYELKQYAWYLSEETYVKGYVNGKNVCLSRFLMNCIDPKKKVDHKDGNTLNNQRSNLRVVTIGENNQNRNKSSKQMTSKYVGVSYLKSTDRWIAVITLNGKNELNKRFKTELEAMQARNKRVIELNATKNTKYKIQEII